jgi:sodium-dependent dicarboxylate transporter 2/3/5
MVSRRIGLAIGPALAAVIWIWMTAQDLPPEAARAAAITALCAAWWVLEPIPIPATSLIPFAAFPLVGVLDHKQVAASYGHTLILLLMGGFMLSAAIERSGAHRRMALGMVRLTGLGGRRIVLGFMLASGLCSMWISNTATVLMLLPVALAVLDQSENQMLERALLLGIAYAASIGGVATPVGTPPNVIFMAVYADETGVEYSFLEWMKVGVPVAMIFIPIAWLYLTRNVGAVRSKELPTQGPWQKPEVRVLCVFVITALAWVLRVAPAGGWSEWFGIAGTSESTVALAAVVALFLIPNGEGDALLDWETARTIPWGLLILFGGGLAIAQAFKSSGLSEILATGLGELSKLHVVAMIGSLCLAVTFLTEVTSNTATTSLLMPILAGAAVAAKLDDPRILMIPAALSASCAFMLPVATAPNAVVFGTKKITTRTMASEGLLLNLIGVMVITAVCVVLL